MARSLGIKSPLTDSPSIALGASEVNLLELTAAYNVLANNGYGIFVHGIRTIENTSGEILFQRTGQGPGQVIETDLTSRMVGMLESTIRSGTGTVSYTHLTLPTNREV